MGSRDSATNQLQTQKEKKEVIYREVILIFVLSFVTFDHQ